MKKYLFAAVFAAVFAMPIFAQSNNNGGIGDDFSLYVPSFDVRMSMGFNYDILRSLTDVSFDKPMGYLALTLPLGFGGNLQDFLGDDVMDEIFDSSGVIRRGNNFKPNAYASQNDNYTVRVDMPMLYGVGSFAYTQNFFFNLSTNIGGSSIIDEYIDIREATDEADVSGFIALKGALRLPFNISMGWETMSFGYAHRVLNNDNMIIALNLHRHLFHINTRMNADIDLLGHAGVESRIRVADGVPDIEFSFNDEVVNFSSDDCNGLLNGRYTLTRWSPSIGLRLWRFSLDSRFGFKAKARGSASGKFIMPNFVDLDTWEVTLIDTLDGLADRVSQNPASVFGIIPNDLDSIVYEIGNTMHWEMPSGHTIGFDIIRNKLSVSYTKLFGDLNWKIEDIYRVRTPLREGETLSPNIDTENDTLRFDMGVKIDHILVFNLNTSWLFGQIGVAGIEFWSRDKHGNVTYSLRDVDDLQTLRIGDVAMVVPILGGGVDLGASAVKLRLELNIFPLPALRTGIRYHF